MSEFSGRTQFIYSALPSIGETIRLLTLWPGEFEDPIRCSLEVVHLGDEYSYSAVSHVWGRSEPEVAIDINDSTVLIRRPLYLCLKRLRDPSESRCLWVDSLSIDQDDIDERSRQVALMGRIYSQARDVRAYVGEHDSGSEDLFRDPGLANAVLSKHRFHFWKERYQDGRRFEYSLLAGAVILHISLAVILVRSCGNGPDPVSIAMGSVGLVIALILMATSIGFIAIRPSQVSNRTLGRQFADVCPQWVSFTRREFWKRLWIIQEIALARRVIVHCGPDSADWQTLVQPFLRFDCGDRRIFNERNETLKEVTSFGQSYDGSVAFTQDDGFVEPDCQGVTLLHSLMRTTDSPAIKHDLTELVIATSYARCSEPRDRIYAMLALTRGHSLVPDYRIEYGELIAKALSPAHRQAIRKCLRLNDRQMRGIESHWYPEVEGGPTTEEQIAEVIQTEMILAEARKMLDE